MIIVTVRARLPSRLSHYVNLHQNSLPNHGEEQNVKDTKARYYTTTMLSYISVYPLDSPSSGHIPLSQADPLARARVCKQEQCSSTAKPKPDEPSEVHACMHACTARNPPPLLPHPSYYIRQ